MEGRSPTEPQGPSRSQRIVTLGFAVLLGAYLTFHLLFRLAAGEELADDEAEQLLLAQSLDWGYGLQPPLYTWLVLGASQLFGVSVLTLTAVRFLLLGTLYLFLYLSARRVLTDARLGLLAPFSLLIVPVFAWDLVFQLTHTLLLAVACAALLYITLRLFEEGKTIHYAALGAVVGLGVLSKYNFEVFALALLLAGLSLPETRSRLLNWRLLVTVLVGGAIVLFHGVWLAENWTRIGGGLAGRTGIDESSGFFTERGIGLAKLALGLLTTAAPLVPVLFLFFGRPTSPPASGFKELAARLLDRYLLALVVVLLIHVLAGGVTRFFPRWLAPFLVPVPLWFFLRLPAFPQRSWRLRAFGLLLLGAIMAVPTLRCLDDFVWRKSSSKTANPFLAEAISRLRAEGFQTGTVVTDDFVLAGTARLVFPDVKVTCQGYAQINPKIKVAGEPCLVMWRAAQGKSVPKQLRTVVADRLRHLKRQGKAPSRPAAVGDVHYLILPPTSEPT